VSVIIPARDAARWLGACLDAIAAQTAAPAHEVIVVDDASADDTAQVARSHPAVTRVVTGSGRGSYAARNAAVALGDGEVLAFTDADCVPDPGWLAAGVGAIESGAGLAGGEVVSVALRHPPNAWERYDRAMYLRQDELIREERFAATANLFVRRTVIDDVGAFDASLRSGGDYEFGRRATGAGYRLVYAPEACVVHRPRASLWDTWRLHRRLGAGWAALARKGARPALLEDGALRVSLGSVIDRAAASGDALRRREIAHVHAVVMAARWTGRITGRG
jgi:glycosyltransferase involved in cell wall biosynthesis